MSTKPNLRGDLLQPGAWIQIRDLHSAAGDARLTRKIETIELDTEASKERATSSRWTIRTTNGTVWWADLESHTMIGMVLDFGIVKTTNGEPAAERPIMPGDQFELEAITCIPEPKLLPLSPVCQGTCLPKPDTKAAPLEIVDYSHHYVIDYRSRMTPEQRASFRKMLDGLPPLAVEYSRAPEFTMDPPRDTLTLEITDGLRYPRTVDALVALTSPPRVEVEAVQKFEILKNREPRDPEDAALLAWENEIHHRPQGKITLVIHSATHREAQPVFSYEFTTAFEGPPLTNTTPASISTLEQLLEIAGFEHRTPNQERPPHTFWEQSPDRLLLHMPDDTLAAAWDNHAEGCVMIEHAGKFDPCITIQDVVDLLFTPTDQEALELRERAEDAKTITTIEQVAKAADPKHPTSSIWLATCWGFLHYLRAGKAITLLP